MNISRSGIIINTENYVECVAFYKNLFGLDVLFEKAEGDFKLTCLDYGGAYLMIETGGTAKQGGKSISENSTKLRFNVADLPMALEQIRAYGIDAEIMTHEWGSTINVHDPDGNRVGIKDEATFLG